MASYETNSISETNPVSVLIGAVARHWPLILVRGRVGHEGLLALAGFVSILFGVLIALFPGAGVLSVLWLIGSLAVVFGIFTVALALSLRTRRTKTLPSSEEEPAEVVGSSRVSDEHIR